MGGQMKAAVKPGVGSDDDSDCVRVVVAVNSWRTPMS
ncbi:uncharacterized protein G2W53_014519 [Senna tora]|uniref:Uncharacterized protein n=1 Tax=Senna tora TaxID=362788 RepID=A0A835C6J8_9FABA|nr:uncharacterized protein G2W53_014519 [Senna tora]